MEINIDFGLITVVLVILKLTGVVSWPWWVVLLPAILFFSFFGLIFFLAFLVKTLWLELIEILPLTLVVTAAVSESLVR